MRIAHGYARDPNSAVQGATGDPSHFICSPTNKCKGYVVLVTFPSETDPAKNFYNGYDQPYGYSWDLFNQFFNGGYKTGVPAYKGATALSRQATGKAAETEAVFGSLRAYFDEVYGGDIIEFEILNKRNSDGSPMWLDLPKTKYDYADLSGGSSTFWDDAEAAVRADDTNGDVLNPVPSSFPYKTAPPSTAATLLANKAIYVYSGLTPTNYSPLHPRVDVTTWSATNTRGIGARMVMGERQGWDDWGHKAPKYTNKEHSVNRFAGIGLHVHEWGHLFGFNHPDGLWKGLNPHPTPQQTNVSFDPANLLGRGSMQDGAHGPKIAGKNDDGTPSHYNLAYRSCPNPYNPFYRMDLKWNTTETIRSSMIDKKIRPGPAHIYVVPSINGQDYLLDFRDVSDSNKNFGKYAAYNELSSSGLLIWRRASGTAASNPMLIPADGRSIDDARFPVGGPDPYDIMFDDLPSDPFGAAPQTHGPTITEATDATHLRHATQRSVGNLQSANPDPGPSRLAFRNIAIRSDSGGAYAEVDIHFIPLPPTNLTTTTVDDDDNAVTLSWTAPSQNGDTITGYQYSIDEGKNWTTIGSGTTITNLTDTKYTFQVRTVTNGVAPHNVSSVAEEEFAFDRPGTVTLTSSMDGGLLVDDVLTATLADPNLSDSDWQNGVSWQWQRKNVRDANWTNIPRATATGASARYTLTLGDVGKQIRATVRYNDGVGDAEDMAESAPVVFQIGAQLAGAATLLVNETIDPNATGPVAVGVYRNTDPNPNAPVWSLIGADASTFTLVQTSGNAGNERTLQFKEPPNYEVPLAEGGYKTTYNVGVVVQDVPLSGAVGATDGAVSDTLLVTVSVVNVEEAGSVVLSPPPQVGVPLVARLTDPDEGLTFIEASWAWFRRAGDAGSWQSVSMPAGAAGAADNYPELSSYTPSSSDVGYHLRATVNYTDHHGPNKSAEGATSAPVIGLPSAPQAFDAVAGDGQVALSWQVPLSDGGSPIERYKVRYFPSADRLGGIGWTEVPGGWSARDTTLVGLTNETAYVFRVVAENGVGRGDRAGVEATPQAPACSITGPATPTVAENATGVVGQYTVAGAGCGSVAWLALGGAAAGAFALQGAETARSLHFLNAPDYEVKHRYQVEVRVRVGSAEKSLAVVVSVSNEEERGSVSLTGGGAAAGGSGGGGAVDRSGWRGVGCVLAVAASVGCDGCVGGDWVGGVGCGGRLGCGVGVVSRAIELYAGVGGCGLAATGDGSLPRRASPEHGQGHGGGGQRGGDWTAECAAGV